jgi:hypothetical protein
LLPVRFTADDLKASAAAKADRKSVSEWIRSPIYFMPTLTRTLPTASFADEKRNASFGSARFS